MMHKVFCKSVRTGWTEVGSFENYEDARRLESECLSWPYAAAKIESADQSYASTIRGKPHASGDTGAYVTPRNGA